jgi:hypothetical protein
VKHRPQNICAFFGVWLVWPYVPLRSVLLKILVQFNPLNADLNPTYHLLALLGGATIVDVSRLRVKVALNRTGFPSFSHPINLPSLSYSPLLGLCYFLSCSYYLTLLLVYSTSLKSVANRNCHISLTLLLNMIISIKSRSFCITTFSASVTICPHKYRLQMTGWSTVVVIVTAERERAFLHSLRRCAPRISFTWLQ